MNGKRFNSRVIQKHDTEEKWSKVNFVPMQGEIVIFDIDENHTYARFKIGDGRQDVNALPFVDDDVRKLITTEIAAVNKEIDNLHDVVGDVEVSTQIGDAIAKIDYPVDSVNGKTGAVILSASDVGADASGSANDALAIGKAYTDSEINKWVGDTTVSSQINSAISEKADTDHTHSEYVNKNAFGNVVVGSSTIAADSTTDTLTLVAGENIILTPDAINGTVSIEATDTVYKHPVYSSKVGDPVADKAPGYGGTFKVSQIVVDTSGHVPGVVSRTITLPSVDDAFSATSTNPVQNKVVKTAIDNLNTLVGVEAVSKQVSDAFDNAITGLSVSGKTITYTKGDGTFDTITTQDTNTIYTAGNGINITDNTIKNTGVTSVNGTTGDVNLKILYGSDTSFKTSLLGDSIASSAHFQVQQDGKNIWLLGNNDLDGTLRYQWYNPVGTWAGNGYILHDKNYMNYIDISKLGITGVTTSTDGLMSASDKIKLEYVISDIIENEDSLRVIDESGASTSANDNSAYFDKEYLVVDSDTYKLDKDTMLSLQNKHLTGNGSVAWKDWDTMSYDPSPSMLSSALKVRYADDPIYMSMKLPSEARLDYDFVVRPAMRESYNTGEYTRINSIGAIVPVDYTKLPDEVVVCIGNLSLYTLSRDENAKWKLFDRSIVPTGYAMYYVPWSSSGDKSERIDASKVEICNDYIRFTLTKNDFAPSSTVEGSVAKVLHYWGKHKNIDLPNNRAVIVLAEMWVETEAASNLLYVGPGCDQKNDSGSLISQNFWGRNHLLSTNKRVVIGHNISDELYDILRGTPNDPRIVYNHYGSVNMCDYYMDEIQAATDNMETLNTTVSSNTNKVNTCYSMLTPTEVLVPGINLNDGVYETGWVDSAGANYNGYYTQAFRSVNYIPVEGGRTICLYYDKADWNNNNYGKAFAIMEYDENKVIIGGRVDFRPYVNNQNSHTLNANTRYIRIAFNNWSDISDLANRLSELKAAVYYIEDAVLEFVEYGSDAEYGYMVDANNVVLSSPNGTRYVLSVSDDGTLSVSLLNS